ncbi:hypothetical protein [Streptacidiphilus anmyonensis]|uniref:hypothetical protein n=1 Tax=Streptacidiphilus anmyonensis TaxID=405782 RepID=UPI001F2825FD|nr:hypothetical protein [Streptacidiphilus anmyonensis]
MARGHGRDSESLETHPARDDLALRTACEDAAMGRWDAPRDVIAASGRDWDRRVFRLQILARHGVRLRWAETWASAEPGNPDAVVMLAHVQALRAILAGETKDRELLDSAWQTCLRAADALPPDPSPWLVLMALTRTLAPDTKLMQQLWAEASRRDPYGREGHHELLAYLMPRHHGSAAMMFDWAHERAQLAPRGTPIAVLLLVAQAEHYRHRTQQDPQNLRLVIHSWTDRPDVDLVLDHWWSFRSPRRHANFIDDAHYLAHALSFAGRHAEAVEVFEEIGPYMSQLPWALCGDAEQLFRSHREQAMKPVRANPGRWRRST